MWCAPCPRSEKAALTAFAETLPKVLITDIDLNWLQVRGLPRLIVLCPSPYCGVLMLCVRVLCLAGRTYVGEAYFSFLCQLASSGVFFFFFLLL